jgi:uncharacterized membrane protein YdbT with pleckstrin-like domain
MSSQIVRFRSKIGAIVIIPAAIVLLLGGASAANALAAGRPVAAFFLALPIALVAWLAVSTRYSLTPDALIIESGFRQASIPLNTIRSVRRTRTILAAPALSLDRLEITHAAGVAVISPRHRERFLAEVHARCPGVDLQIA